MGQYTEQGYHFGLTAPQIEELLMMVKDFSRPNLVHNWDFFRRIDQRNKISTGITSGGLDNDRTFTIDRWYIGNAYPNTTVSTTSTVVVDGKPTGGIKISMTDNSLDRTVKANRGCLRQTIYTFGNNYLQGQDVTISVLYSDGSLLSTTGHIPVVDTTLAVGTVFNSIVINGDDDLPVLELESRRQGAHFHTLCIYDSNKVVRAVKIEIGIGQTLGRKVGAIYNINDIIDYQKEFDICKKFFRIVVLPKSLHKLSKSSSSSYPDKHLVSICVPDILNMISTPSVVGMSRAYLVCVNDDNGGAGLILCNAGYGGICDYVTISVNSNTNSNIVNSYDEKICGNMQRSIVIQIDNDHITQNESESDVYLCDGTASTYGTITGVQYPSATIALSADI